MNALVKVEAGTFFTVEVYVIIEIYETFRGDYALQEIKPYRKSS